MDSVDLKSWIRDVPDFPKPGILFRDVTPLLQDPAGLRTVVNQWAAQLRDPVDFVVGIESRGFIFGTPLAYYLKAGFIPVRKPGKLPPPIFSQRYSLEYGSDCLEMRDRPLPPGSRVLIVDDVIATGGTAAATARLVKQTGGTLCGFAFVIELAGLNGRIQLPSVPVISLITYE